MSGGLILGIAFCVLVIPLAIFLILRLQREVTAQVQKAKTELETLGYVTDLAYMRPIGDLTRVWSRYSQPINLYVQASNLDPVSIAAGHLGIADIKLGHPEFDSLFVVRSNSPELAARVFDAEVREALLKHDKVRFRTGSLTNLLGADYFPEKKKDRDLRDFWMMEKAGKLGDEEAKELFALGKRIATKAEMLGRMPGKSFKSSFTEGR